MKLRIVTAVLLLASGIWVKPGDTQAAAAPATQPLAVELPTTLPSTRPTTLPMVRPLSASMIERLKQRRQKELNQQKVAYINLDDAVVERPAAFALFEDRSLTLQSIVSRLHQAKKDKDVAAVLLNLGNTDLNLAQAQEVRDALTDLRKAQKRAFVYSDTYDTASYVAASGASDVCMLEGGEIMLPGVSLQTMFARGLLDKVGVKADYVQIGQYKGADEQFTRTEPSTELRGELNKIIDSLYEQIVEGISTARHLPKATVQDAINQVVMTGKTARERGFVDHLVDQDGLRGLMKDELGKEVDLVHDYGMPEREAVDFSSPLAFLSLFSQKPQTSHKPAVALIYLDGVIVDGSSGDDLFGAGGQIGSDDLRKSLRMASRDKDVEAIVLRIDSPGGSAMASEVMWQAARRAAKDKPLIISIGSMAASGGYYVASAGDHIIADPTAIVGSIGVVGGKFVLKDLFEKIGLHTETFSRGNNAALFSPDEPFSDQQRKMVTGWMQQTYEQFTQRILTTRGKQIKAIDDVARGRVFLAGQARQLGLVDELGGLDTALAYAAKEAKLDEGDYEVKVLPATRTLADLIMDQDPEAKLPFRPKVSLSADSLLGDISPSAGRVLKQQIQLLRLLGQRPVILASPFVVTIK